MSKEITTIQPEKSARHLELLNYLSRQITRCEGIIKDRMEGLMTNFNTSFEWNAEEIYKTNIKLNFLRDIYNTISEEGCDEANAKFHLRHAIEHSSDDVMLGDPYNHSSNGATNLAHRWNYEMAKTIYHLADNLLDRLTDDEE